MPTEQASDEYVMLTFRVTADLAARLSEQAPRGQRSEAIRTAVEDYLATLPSLKPNE